MNNSSPGEYQITLSAQAFEWVKEISKVAVSRGDSQSFLHALKEFHRRLRIYPQFGDPLVDLVEHHGQIRIGIIPPLAMRYAVYEDQRLVIISAKPVLLIPKGK
jgi:hypothetical protein